MNISDISDYTILLVGNDEDSKRKLAKKLTEISHKVIIRMTSNLNQDKYDVDFIALVFDLKNQESLNKIQKYLSHIDFRFFMGKVCLFGINDSDVFSHCTGFDVVQNLADSFCLPVIYSNIKNENELTQSSIQLINQAKLPISAKYSTIELIDAI